MTERNRNLPEAERQRRSERGKRLVQTVLKTPEARAAYLAAIPRAAAKQRATKLPWCPPEYWVRYRELTNNKGLTASEARSVIEWEMGEEARRAAAAERVRLASMTKHERDLERLRNGATLVEKVVIRAPDYAFTLGGVSDL